MNSSTMFSAADSYLTGHTDSYLPRPKFKHLYIDGWSEHKFSSVLRDISQYYKYCSLLIKNRLICNLFIETIGEWRLNYSYYNEGEGFKDLLMSIGTGSNFITRDPLPLYVDKGEFVIECNEPFKYTYNSKFISLDQVFQLEIKINNNSFTLIPYLEYTK